jgi:hypothetical protein
MCFMKSRIYRATNSLSSRTQCLNRQSLLVTIDRINPVIASSCRFTIQTQRLYSFSLYPYAAGNAGDQTPYSLGLIHSFPVHGFVLRATSGAWQYVATFHLPRNCRTVFHRFNIIYRWRGMTFTQPEFAKTIFSDVTERGRGQFRGKRTGISAFAVPADTSS